jgi:hypothetical protein
MTRSIACLHSPVLSLTYFTFSWITTAGNFNIWCLRFRQRISALLCISCTRPWRSIAVKRVLFTYTSGYQRDVSWSLIYAFNASQGSWNGHQCSCSNSSLNQVRSDRNSFRVFLEDSSFPVIMGIKGTVFCPFVCVSPRSMADADTREGLLPLLKSIQRPTEMKKFSGLTLGVDAYVWLHRGAIACASLLAQGKPTRK